MKQVELTLVLVFILLFFIINLKAQQGYSGLSVWNCSIGGTSAPPSPSYLYTCNGQKPTCQTFLLFNSHPNLSSVSALSKLMSSDPAELARANNVSISDTFVSDKEVIVPINCSCSGQYYQANTSYTIGDEDTYFSLANEIYQGLTSCSALTRENPYDARELYGGLNLQVPLRCACPTKKQSNEGIQYLLTYSVFENDSIDELSRRFNVSEQSTLAANGLSGQEQLLYWLTTILIPLPRRPLSSQTVIHHPIQYSPPPPPTLATAPPLVQRAKSKRVFPLIGVGVGSLLSICACTPVALCLRKRLKKAAAEKKHKKRYMLPKDVLDYQAGASRALKVFEIEELEAATNNFNSERRLGGSVYKGILGGDLLAIKEMRKDASKEVNILHKLNHFNLISLLGLCLSQDNCYLVYEYMQNGSLKDWLYNCTSHVGFWCLKQRIQVALDIAKGLDYLHNFAEPPYVHNDIKSSNILLNGHLRAKIANFSSARASEREEDGCAVTKNVEGTLGYIAPEYLESGMVTPKLDVFAFGVVMLELITGKDAIVKHEGREKLLSTVIISMVEGKDGEAKLLNFMEPAMREDSHIDIAMVVLKLSVACLNPEPVRRPRMEEVVSILSIIQRDLLNRESL